MLRKVLDAFHPSPRRDQVAPTGFIKDKLASPKMEIVELDPVLESHGQEEKQTRHVLESQASLLTAGSISRSQVSPNTSRGQYQLRSLSSMSAHSEIGDRVREARSECVTRRTSYCSAREGIEDRRDPVRMDVEADFFTEAME